MLLKTLNEIKYIIWLKPVKDALWNFWAYFIVIFSWIITSSILAKNINPDEYWMIGLIIGIVWLLASFIWFGYFEWYWLTLLKEENKEKQKELIWTWLIIMMALILIFFLLIILSLPLINLIYKNIEITKTILYTSIVSSFSISTIFIMNTTKYLWKMKWQAFYSLIQPTIYLIWVISLFILDLLKFEYVITISYLAIIIWLIIISIFLKPNFKNIKENYYKIKDKQKKEGWHIYIWQSFERATFKLDTVIIWIFNTTSVAFYTLWNMLIQPIWIFSSKLTDSLVRDLNKKERIPNKIFIYNFLWWLTNSIILLLISKYIILFLWTSEYLIILDFLVLLLFIPLTRNFYYIIYIFLNIKNKNKDLKKYFYIRSIINLFWNIILIPLLWIKWAIIATLLSNIVFWIWCFIEYKKLKN